MGLFSNIFKSGTTISPQEAHDILSQSKDAVLLDVRSPGEYRQARIKGAKLIPVDELPSRAASELPDKGRHILVYCQSGARAGSAVSMLTKMGYENVQSFGGIMSWPYEIVKGA